MRRIALLLGALLMCSNALAVEGVIVQLGNGDATNMARAGVTWSMNKQWFTDGDWQVAGHWEAAVGNWRGHSEKGDNQSVWDVGVTPVFRFEQKKPSYFAPYLEAAIGFHLISPTYINADRKFSTAFQFGDHVGFGLRVGEKQQFELGYRFQHLSNGSIKEPNQGINFNQIHMAYHF